MNKLIEEIRSALFRILRPAYWAMVKGRKTSYVFTEKVMTAMKFESLYPVVYEDMPDPEMKLPRLAFNAVIVRDGVITDTLWIGNEPFVGYGFQIEDTGTCETKEGPSVYHHRKRELMEYMRRAYTSGHYFTDTEWWQLLSKEKENVE